MKISLCTTCMGRAHHLKQTLPRNLADSVDWSRPDAVEFVVLDYSSPDDLAEWITTDPELRPYLEAGILKFARSEGHTSFRHSHAKNMAHALATGDYVCNVDADNFLGFGFVHYLRAVFRRRPNAIVATNRLDTRLNLGVHKGSMGRIAMSRANFAPARRLRREHPVQGVVRRGLRSADPGGPDVHAAGLHPRAAFPAGRPALRSRPGAC